MHCNNFKLKRAAGKSQNVFEIMHKSALWPRRQVNSLGRLEDAAAANASQGTCHKVKFSQFIYGPG